MFTLIERTIVVEMDEDKYKEFTDEKLELITKRIDEVLDTHFFNMETDIVCITKPEHLISAKEKEF